MAGADIGNMNTRANQALEAGCDMLIVCNQTRALLLEVLHTITIEQSPESAQRIEAFKKKMPRFTLDKQDKITPFLSLTLHGQLEKESALVSGETINNTKTI